MPFISVVIPVYNSEKSLEELNERLGKVLGQVRADYEIIMVDDHSTDKSYAVMQNLRKNDKRVKIIGLNTNCGQHTATVLGFDYCQGEYVVTIDDDLQSSPEDITILLEKIDEGYDVVFGVYQQKQHVRYRNWGSFFIDKFLNVMFRKPSHIRCSSFRILKKDIIRKMLAKPAAGHIYIARLILENTLNIASVHVGHQSRKYGESNYTLAKSIKLAGDLFLGCLYSPLKKVYSWRYLIMAVIFLLSSVSVWLIGYTGFAVILIILLAGSSGLTLFVWLANYIRKTDGMNLAAIKPHIIENMEIG